MTRYVRFTAFWLIVGIISGCGATPQDTQLGKGTAIEEKLDGESIFKQNCISCHGADLQGRVGPNLQKIGSTLTEEQIAEIVQKGKGGMPGFSKHLDQEQIDALAAWLAQKK